MDIRTNFKIGDIEFILKPLKMKQVKLLTGLFQGPKIDTKGTDLEILKNLIETKLATIMGIIFFDQPWEAVDWDDVDFEIIDEVVDNFFVLNPRLKMRLLQLSNIFVKQAVLNLTPLIKGITSK